jgi:hypothetical protein
MSAGIEANHGATIPRLPDDIAKQVGEVEERIDTIMAKNEDLHGRELEHVVTAADAMLQTRPQYQGEQWWETLDARRQLTKFLRWVELSSALRAEWVQAVSLNGQVSELYRADRYTEALPLAQRALSGLINCKSGVSPDMAIRLEKAR